MSTVKALLETRQGFTKWKPLLDKLKQNVTAYERLLLDDITLYYSTFQAAEELGDKFSLWFFNVRRPSLSEDEKGLYRAMMQAECDGDTAATLYKSLRDRAVLEKTVLLAEEILSGNSKHKAAELVNVVADLGEVDAFSLERYIVTDNTRELVSRVYGPGLNWKQVWMNQSCGPLRKGDFVALVARPDTGKTSFVANQVISFAKQLGPEDVVLWINNEQEGGKVLVRIKQVATGMPGAEIIRSPDGFDAQFNEQMRGCARIIVVDKADASVFDIDSYAKMYGDRLKLIVIDQAWKVEGCGVDTSDVATQTRIAQKCRHFAKTLAPVIGVYQADASVEGVEYFGMDKVYQVKTALQGEADLVICMGRSFADGKQASRYFCFPKNKLAGGGAYFQEQMRSWKHETTFNTETGVFK